MLASCFIRCLFLARPFNQHLSKKPIAMTKQMQAIAKRYILSWIINSCIWGVTPLLFAIWLPYLNQAFCEFILVALAGLTLARTHTRRKLMHQLTGIFIGAQFAAVCLSFFLTEPQSRVPSHIVIHLIGLFCIYFLLKGTSINPLRERNAGI